MARIVGYIAASLDGFIAGPGDNLDWLETYGPKDLGEHDYNLFIKGIKTVVMGRATYDWLEQSPHPWGYANQRVIVVTSRPIVNPIAPLETRSNVDELVHELHGLDEGDVWMLGGGKLQMAFIERHALDEIEVYVIPVIIGGGMPLFPATGANVALELMSVKQIEGTARLHYRLSK